MFGHILDTNMDFGHIFKYVQSDGLGLDAFWTQICIFGHLLDTYWRFGHFLDTFWTLTLKMCPKYVRTHIVD